MKRSDFNEINLTLKKSNSWSNDIDLYGKVESNCFEVISDDEDNVVSVSFRIDFRSRYESILRFIIEFCSLNGLIILDEDITIIPLNFELIKSKIENSRQIKIYNELSNEKKKFGKSDSEY